MARGLGSLSFSSESCAVNELAAPLVSPGAVVIASEREETNCGTERRKGDVVRYCVICEIKGCKSFDRVHIQLKGEGLRRGLETIAKFALSNLLRPTHVRSPKDESHRMLSSADLSIAEGDIVVTLKLI